MSEKQREKFNPDVFGIMEWKLARNRKGLKAFIELKKGNAASKIFDFNTVDGIPDHILPLESVDIIVTSPPYGDSRTTVAYGQFSRLANQWLGFENANQIDNLLMGGKRKKEKVYFESDLLNEVIEKIAEKDKKRVNDVISFYIDYKKSINNLSKVVRKGGYVCYVVGNRKVKGITLPTDEITKQFFETNGFTHIKTIIRNIPNKRMPSKNSPTNVAGDLDTTMNKEYIVVLKKRGILQRSKSD
ncbi:MAG: DNA methyltransferase [Methanosarcinales archaeon]